MWRYHVTVKGSDDELKWLNQQAQRGQRLCRITGNWYQFQATKTPVQLFSEYVTSEVATDIEASQPPFELVTKLHLKQPDVQVIYTATTQASLDVTRVDRQNAPLQLKVALAQRGHLMNVMNLRVVLGLLLAMILIYFRLMNDTWGGWYGLIWILFSFYPAWQASRIHKQANALRVVTQQYDDAWRPTMHVFLKNMAAPLEIEKVASIGQWQYVGQDHRGMYWYDVRTLASASEIKQTLQPALSRSVTVSIVSWLGLAPIGYL